MAERLMVIDGMSLLHRAYHALPTLMTADGIPTGGVYGFLNMLMRLWAEQKPNYLVVATDRRGPTFRHEAFAGYKAQRTAAPDDLLRQFDLFYEALDALNIPVIGLQGYEGDDVLGTLAALAEARGYDVLLVTGDRDALQLVSDHTTVLLTRKGISQLERCDPEGVERLLGVRPDQVADYKGLTGDSSDNLPGVPGIGPKGAVELLAGGLHLEDVLSRLDEVKRPRLRALLETHAESARHSRDLATIHRSVPLEAAWEKWQWRPAASPVAVSLLTRLEFRSLLARLEGGQAPVEEAPPADSLPAAAAVSLRTEPELLAGEGELALWWEGERVFAAEERGAGELSPEGLERLLRSGRGLRVHDGKARLTARLRQGGPPYPMAFDTAVAAYLLMPGRTTYPFADEVRAHLPETVGEGAAAAAQLFRLADALESLLREQELGSLFREVEMPLLPILAGMEATGVRVDPGAIDALMRELGERIATVTGEIHRLAGEPFSISSVPQLRHVLFEKLHLPVIKKTKTGPSTDAEVLEQLASEHEIVERILEYRQLVKLKGTYLDGLLPLVDAGTHRIHTTFHQTATATGRLSSSDPNLQNIPIRSELGKRIRRIFVPSPGQVFLAADYSQIELRVLAHFCGDETLLRAFRQGEDIHRRTAAEVFGVSPEEVTAEMRRRAKAVNFGIVYGISDFGLARDLGIPRKEAAAFIERYLQRYVGVRAYMDRMVAQARDQGYVTTLLGRRRYLPEVRDRRAPLRNMGERMAMNSPIQGTAADIIKIAMVEVARRLAERPLGRLLLQVHDELILETEPAQVGDLAALVREAMEGAVSLAVPLVVDVKAGPDWGAVAPMAPAAEA